MTSRCLLSCLVLLTACGDHGAGRAARAPASQPDATPAPPTAPATPAGPVGGSGPRVVFLGTSLTAGLGISRTEDTYVARVAELADSAGLPIRAVNAGVSGATSADGLARIGWVLRDSVDVLVLEIGANDGLRGQNPAATKANLLAIIDSTRARYRRARIIVAGMEAPPNLGATYTKEFHDVFPEVARERHAALIPFLLEGVGGVRALNQDDGIHPNARGERLLARNVWEVLEPVLRSVRSGGQARKDPRNTPRSNGGTS